MKDAPWTAIRNRIGYSLGRQAYTLGESAEAVQHFLRLMDRDDTANGGLQMMVLESLALAYAQLASNPDKLSQAVADGRLELPTPVFAKKRTRIVLPAEQAAVAAGSSSASADGRTVVWAALDEQALAHWDSKGKTPASVLPDRSRIDAAVGETLHAELYASNPLSTPLALSDITVKVDGGEADVETLPEATLGPFETRVISLAITPRAAGSLTLSSVSFNFHRCVPVTESLERHGRRLHATKAQRVTPTYLPDTTLTIHAAEGAPRVVAHLRGVPDLLYEGEVVDAELVLHNAGRTEVERLEAVCSHYGVLSLPQTAAPDTLPNVIPTATPIELVKSIPAGESVTLPVRITALSTGTLELLALIVYTTVDGTPGAVRLAHVADVRRLVSVSSEVTPARSGYIVTVDVVSHADAPVTLDALTPVSQYWAAEAIPGATLLPNQTFRAVLRPTAPASTDIDITQPALVANLGALLRDDLDALTPITPASVALSAPEGYFLQRRAHRLRFASHNFSAVAPDLVPLVLPMFDPLDLDVVFSWTLGARRGRAGVLGMRPAPGFSIVEDLRDERERGAAGGNGKTTRTIYEETDRLRKQVAHSVLEGVYAREHDPALVRARVRGSTAGKVQHDFEKG